MYPSDHQPTNSNEAELEARASLPRERDGRVNFFPDKNGPIKPLTRGQRMGVRGGVIGTILACTAWVMIMAGIANDWLPVIVTVIVDVLLALVFMKLCLQRPTQRFPLLAVLLIIAVAHGLAVFWLRYDGWLESARFSLWRGEAKVTPEALLRQKEMLTITIVSMVVLLLTQFGLIYWLQRRAVRPR